jgi:hypothetical protein
MGRRNHHKRPFAGARAGAGLAVVLALATAPGVPAAEAATAERAALERVAAFFADALAVEGGYVYAWSEDLSVRSGEGGALGPGVIWNQPPGTPAVGAAFLRLHELTGEPRWRAAAGAAARAMLRGQLLSGGWFNFTETRPEARAAWCYRSDGVDQEACRAIANDKRNRSSLDDNITQGGLGFLLWLDAVENGGDAAVREALEYGLGRLVRAQHPNGAWPPFLDRPHAPARFVAAWRASTPRDWPRAWVRPEAGPFFPLNDHLARDVVRLLLAAERRLGREEHLAAARRTGEFLLASQLPGAQRGWAQLYDADLRPVWGRRFEPPAVASRETAGAVEALLRLYVRTGARRYLDGARDGAAWLESVRRPSGDWARFYELGTDRPIFVREDGALSYEAVDLYEGYDWIGAFGIEAVLEIVERVEAGERPPEFDSWDFVFEPVRSQDPAASLALATAAAGPDGRVVENGWIRSETFVEAVRALAAAERGR